MIDQPAFRTHDHRVQLDATRERAMERYDRACRTARYGSTPAIREAALVEARRLRPLVHSGPAAVASARTLG